MTNRYFFALPWESLLHDETLNNLILTVVEKINATAITFRQYDNTLHKIFLC